MGLNRYPFMAPDKDCFTAFHVFPQQIKRRMVGAFDEDVLEIFITLDYPHGALEVPTPVSRFDLAYPMPNQDDVVEVGWELCRHDDGRVHVENQNHDVSPHCFSSCLGNWDMSFLRCSVLPTPVKKACAKHG